MTKNMANRAGSKLAKLVLASAATIGGLGISGMNSTAKAGGVDVDVDIRLPHGRIEIGRRTPPPPRIERVWVEPVYQERTTKVWVEPVYRTVCDRVWREPVTQEVCDKVWVPERVEVRDVAHVDRRGHRTWTRERVIVSPAHYEEQRRTVIVTPGRWENVERQELVAPGHFDTRCERVCVSPGHWEERPVRVVVEEHRYPAYPRRW